MSIRYKHHRGSLAGAIALALAVGPAILGRIALAADNIPPAAIAPPAVRPTAPATPITPAAPAKDAPASGLITNVWIDTDIRQVVQDISSQSNTIILCDQTVQGIVSMSVKDMQLAECLERVCATGGFSFTKVKDYYIVGKADPGSPLFQRMAEPKRIKLSYISPDQVKMLLHASLIQYVNFDKFSGTVVITAPEPIRQRIVDEIALVDQPNPQVAIEAVVFELTEDGSKQLALDWQFQTPHVGMSSKNLTQTFTYGSGSDLGTFVDLTLRAIVESQKGQVLANPRVLVMNNTEAEIFVGQEKYFTLLSGQASNPYYTLQSIKAGVTLKVFPYVGKDGQITLDLEPEVSDVQDITGLNTQQNGGVGASNLPVVTRRHAKTTVSINDGQTILLGGLIREQHRNIIDKTPVVGDIPGIGSAFRQIQEETERQEVVILITAHLVDRRTFSIDKLAPRLEQRYVTPLDAIAAPRKGHTQ